VADVAFPVCPVATGLLLEPADTAITMVVIKMPWSNIKDAARFLFIIRITI
jgi:hypothetical protein